MSSVQTKTWKIGGMTCGGCSASIERALNGAPGVRAASASHEQGTLTLEFAGDADLPGLLGRVEKAGFDVLEEASAG